METTICWYEENGHSVGSPQPEGLECTTAVPSTTKQVKSSQKVTTFMSPKPEAWPLRYNLISQVQGMEFRVKGIEI